MGDNAISSNLVWILAALFAALAAGTVVRLVWLRGAASAAAQQSLASLRTWWLIALLVAAAALFGPTATTVLFALLSYAALRELSRLGRRPNRAVLGVCYALIPWHYLLVWLGWAHALAIATPLALLLAVSATLILQERIRGFLATASSAVWQSLLTIYLPSYAALLHAAPPQSNPVAGGAGWFLLLIVLTEANDIFQALIGRRFGKRRLAPRLSPGKTWEGWLGGGLCTVALAALLAPCLSPLSVPQAAVAAILIAVSGTIGDLTVSALKREAGVKDSSQALPGQGGLMDRLDSLLFAAPVFYGFLLVLVA